jgi:predicted enzyme related to lactoylglutathione lyase
MEHAGLFLARACTKMQFSTAGFAMTILRTISGNSFLCLLLGLGCGIATAAPTLPPLNPSPSGLVLAGKFTWFDLAAPAPAELKSFYRSVFGWSFRSPGQSDDGYALIVNNGREIGGLFRHEPPEGEQDGAVWVALMSVADVDRATATVRANGGQVDVEPADVPRRGRHALYRDPAGALFGVLRSETGDPPDREASIGDFMWVDLFARDVEAMTRFYLALAPYELESREITEGLTHTLLNAHGMPRAGIVPVDEEANRSAWVPYVRVEDVAETLEKVVAGGGFAIIPPDERLLDGNLAVFVDPNGGVTGIVKWDYEGGPAQ